MSNPKRQIKEITASMRTSMMFFFSFVHSLFPASSLMLMVIVKICISDNQHSIFKRFKSFWIPSQRDGKLTMNRSKTLWHNFFVANRHHSSIYNQLIKEARFVWTVKKKSNLFSSLIKIQSVFFARSPYHRTKFFDLKSWSIPFLIMHSTLLHYSKQRRKWNNLIKGHHNPGKYDVFSPGPYQKIGKCEWQRDEKHFRIINQKWIIMSTENVFAQHIICLWTCNFHSSLFIHFLRSVTEKLAQKCCSNESRAFSELFRLKAHNSVYYIALDEKKYLHSRDRVFLFKYSENHFRNCE